MRKEDVSSYELKLEQTKQGILSELQRIRNIESMEKESDQGSETESIELGEEAEYRLIKYLNERKIFPLTEHAPKSLDKSGSRVDIIILLPSLKPLAVQLLLGQEVIDDEYAPRLKEKYRRAAEDGIYPLRRGKHNHPVFINMPMPIAVATVNKETLLRDDSAGLVREFLTDLLNGLDPQQRRLFLQRDRSPRQMNQQEMALLTDYFQEVAEINRRFQQSDV